MGFYGAFADSFQKPFPSAGNVPLWLTGGISASNCLAAYHARGAASQSNAYINLNSPGTYNAFPDPGSAPTWDAVNGFKFLHASGQYLRTGIVGNLPRTVIVRFSNYVNGVWALSGAYPNSVALWPSLGGRAYYDCGTRTDAGAGSSYLTGVAAVSGSVGYKNGSSHVTGLSGAPTSTLEIGIGTAHDSGGWAGYSVTAYIQAVWIYSVAFTGAQIATLSAAILTI